MLSRWTFLTSIPLAAAASVSAGSAAVPYSFDQPEFERRINQPYVHRQVFAARTFAPGIVLHLMQNSLSAYESGAGFNESRSLHVACVMYGSSLLMLLGDSEWKDFKIADLLRRSGEAPGLPQGADGNPFRSEVSGLAQSGASFFVCNNALTNMSHLMSQEAAVPEDLIYTRWTKSFLGNALVVPAGVAALNAMQEAKFTYIQAI